MVPGRCVGVRQVRQIVLYEAGALVVDAGLNE